MSLYIAIGMVLMAALILGIIGVFNSGYRKGRADEYKEYHNETPKDI